MCTNILFAILWQLLQGFFEQFVRWITDESKKNQEIRRCFSGQSEAFLSSTCDVLFYFSPSRINLLSASSKMQKTRTKKIPLLSVIFLFVNWWINNALVSSMKKRRRENFYFSFVRSPSLSLAHITLNESSLLQLQDSSPIVVRETYYFSVLRLFSLSPSLSFFHVFPSSLSLSLVDLYIYVRRLKRYPLLIYRY